MENIDPDVEIKPHPFHVLQKQQHSVLLLLCIEELHNVFVLYI